MAKYRNPAIEAEMNIVDVEEEISKLPEPTTVEEETFKKRYGDLRRHQQKIQEEFEAEKEALRRQLQAAQNGSIRMPKSEAEVEEWSSKYPEFRATLDVIISKNVNDALREYKSKFAQLEEKEKEVTKKEALTELKRRHPDADTLFKQNSDFHKWLSQASKRDQDAIYKSLDVEDADYVISKYKMQKGIVKTSKVEDDFDVSGAAKVVSTRSEPSMPAAVGDYEFTESQVEKMSPREYAANEEKIMSAIRKGKFFYDLSGGARL